MGHKIPSSNRLQDTRPICHNNKVSSRGEQRTEPKRFHMVVHRPNVRYLPTQLRIHRAQQADILWLQLDYGEHLSTCSIQRNYHRGSHKNGQDQN